MFLSRRKQSDGKYRLGRGLLRDNCPAIYTTWRKVANKITRKLMGGLARVKNAVRMRVFPASGAYLPSKLKNIKFPRGKYQPL